MRALSRVGLVAGSATVALALACRPAPPWETWQPEPQALPANNGFAAVVAAAGKAWDLPYDRQGEPETAAGRAESFERNREAVEMLRRALPLPYVEPARYGLDASYPHYTAFRVMARALEVRSRWHAEHGEAAEAMRCRLDAAELGVKVPHGAPMSGCLVGIACEAVARARVPLAVDGLSGADAKAALRRLEAIADQRVPLLAIVCTERRITLASLAMAMRSGDLKDLAQSLWGDTLDHGYGDVFMPALVLGGGKAGLWRRVVRYEDDCVRTVAAASGRFKWPDGSAYGSVVTVFDKSTYGLGHKLARSSTGSSLWLAALALRAYQADHGHYPATLDDLQPGYLRALPADGFGRGPLRYLVRDGKPLLYSVGPDGVDNGGRAIRFETPAKAGGWDWDSRGDVVWGVNRI